MFKKIEELILDLFFPPTETEKILRKINVEEIYKKCEKTFETTNHKMFSVFKYKDPFIKDAIYELKNNKNKYSIKIFAEILKEEIFNYLEENLINVDYKIPITWVPQHKSTYLDKGYNQGEELVAALCTTTPNTFKKKNLLIKTKKTKPQHKIKNRKLRLKNLKKTFSISKEYNLKPNTLIILIDDVYTTGATLSESRRVLLKAGALDVICFTIAH